MRYSFDEFELTLDAFELRKSSELVAVEPQVFGLLVHLIENRDRVVTRDELIEAIWDGRFVSESAVSTRIKSARKAIDDDGQTQRFIKTVHGRGFRFVGRRLVMRAQRRSACYIRRFRLSGHSLLP